MGLFSSNKRIVGVIHLRLAMEWRLLGNVYRNHIQEIGALSVDREKLDLIVKKCVAINTVVQDGCKGMGKPTLDNDLVNSLLAEIIKLDSELVDKPALAFRTKRLVGITISIMSGNYDGILEDSHGNHTDWYRGL